MITISFLLQLVALVLLFLAGIGIGVIFNRVSTFAMGMFFWLLSLMLASVALHPILH